MIQQVNLYQPEIKPTGPWTVPNMARILVGAFLLLALYASYLGWQMGKVNDDIAKFQAQKEEYLGTLENWKKVQAAQRPAELEEELTRLGDEKQRQTQILERVARSDLGNPKGFSPYLEALGKRPLGELWLTNITLLAGGAEVSLGGQTRNAALVPALVEGLQGEAVFAGTRFRALSLTREDADSDAIAFSLQSEGDPLARAAAEDAP